MSRRTRLGLVALGIALVATAAALVAANLETLADEAARWAERAQRIPTPVLETPVRTNAITGDGPIEKSRSTARVLDARPIAGGPVTGLVHHDGALVYGTFDDGAWSVTDFTQPERLAIDDRVNGLAANERGIFVATNGGAWRIDAAGPHRLGTGAFAGVATWRDRAWFVSSRGLSVAADTGFWTRGPEQGVRADSPTTIAPCGEQLCLGALDGLWTFDGRTFAHHTRAGGALPADRVTAIAGTAGAIWVGTFDGGLSRLGDRVRRYAAQDGLPDARIQPHALALVGDVAYAGTATGLLRIAGEEVSLVDGLPREPITAVLANPDGSLWIGTTRDVKHVEIKEEGPCSHAGCG